MHKAREFGAFSYSFPPVGDPSFPIVVKNLVRKQALNRITEKELLLKPKHIMGAKFYIRASWHTVQSIPQNDDSGKNGNAKPHL
jgi:hypothetical protein